MTIFITESFKLDLSHLNIKFSEENTFFEKDLIKQYSFPFKIPRERNFIPLYEFVRSHNSVNSNLYIQGLLFHNDKYYEAEMLLLSSSKTIESVFYYSFQKLTIFDRKLNTLDWANIEVGDDIEAFAQQKIAQYYPTTLINFPQIYAPDTYKDYEFGNGQYAGFINHNVDGEFQAAVYETIYGFTVTRMNEMRPFLYLKEIIKFIFSEIGYAVLGDFVDNASIEKCLLYHSNPIYYTNNDYARNENLTLTLSQSNVSGYNPIYLTYNEYVKEIVMSSYGTYKVRLSVEGDIQANSEECFIRCYFNDNQLTGGFAIARNNDGAGDFYRDFEFEFHVPKDEVGNTFEIRIITTTNTKPTIEGELELTGTLRPLYRNFIALKDLLPDVTVGAFVNAVKETFNMTSIFDPSTQTVRFDFFNSFVDNQQAINLSNFGVDAVPRKFNRSVGYKISFSDGEVLNLNKDGDFITTQVGFSDKKIPIEPLPVTYIDAQPNVKHQDGLSLLFFESNADAKPLVIDGDIAFHRLGFVHTFLRNWYYQNLNSEEYKLTVNLPIYISAKLNAESKIWFYNNYFLVHNLKRENINPLFEKVNLRLFKLKSYPTFNLIIDGGDGGGPTEYEPPTAITSAFGAFGALFQTTEFNATIYGSAIGGPSYFTVDIYANGSTDPQGLSLSFGWQVLSSPDGNASGSFVAQNADHSITRFTNSSYINLAGVYSIRLTVINSVGLSDTIDLTVTAS